MTHEYLLCPQCRCPLTPPARAAAGMTCPRCNQWVELDPQCNGVCSSCHKTFEKKNMTACTEPETVLISIEKLRETPTQSQPQPASVTPDNCAETGWKGLLKRLFPVR